MLKPVMPLALALLLSAVFYTKPINWVPSFISFSTKSRITAERPAEEERHECPICFANLMEQNALALTCHHSHIYCRDCIDTNLRATLQCSLCQAPLNNNQIDTLLATEITTNTAKARKTIIIAGITTVVTAVAAGAAYVAYKYLEPKEREENSAKK